MFWGKGKDKNKTKSRGKPETIDLRKRFSIFSTFSAKRKKETDSEDSLKCTICFKKITSKPLFCNQYVTRSRLCNAGPFCSNECWEAHMENSTHY